MSSGMFSAVYETQTVTCLLEVNAWILRHSFLLNLCCSAITMVVMHLVSRAKLVLNQSTVLMFSRWTSMLHCSVLSY